MNPLQLMEYHKDNFTQNDLLIYDTITSNPSNVIHMTTSALAEACGVSQPALSRFIKALGYNKYQDFRTDLVSWLALKNEQESQGSDHLAYFQKLYDVLAESEKVLTADYMEELSSYMDSFKRIFLSGKGKSYHPAQLFYNLMLKSYRSIQAVPLDFITELTDAMNEDDLLVMFSVSGGAHVMKDACHTNGKVMLVTTNANHEFRKEIDRTVVLPYIPPDPETSSISPVLFDIFVELLCSYMLKQPEHELK